MGLPQPDTGAVTEDVGVVGGFITATGDADFGPFFNNDAGQWTAQTISGAYGSQLVIDSDGVWTYTADNSNAAIQALNTGGTLTEVFTVSSTQGTTTITITINGADEPPCFVSDTLIDTPLGPRPVQDLRAGDEVLTRDNGVQRISWAGSRELLLDTSDEGDGLQPIRLRKGSLGRGVPDRDLLLSPMHRVVLQGPLVSLMTGHEEVLCALRHLVNGVSILREQKRHVRYHHLLFEAHQVLLSHGCASESFYPGALGLEGFGDATREEVLRLFPELRSLPESYGPLARPEIRGFEARCLQQALWTPMLRKGVHRRVAA
jgi:VCBS repeat-containing protein